MTINDFNSRINLPLYCSDLGVKGYEFLKIPRFGWYAYNKDYSEVFDIFDFISWKDAPKAITHLIKEKKQYQDFTITYTERGVTNTVNDFKNRILMKSFYNDCVSAFHERNISLQGRKVVAFDEMQTLGYTNFHRSGIGAIDTNVMAEHIKHVPLIRTFQNKLLIPSFCTPKHICSLEIVDFDDLKKCHSFYTAVEKGWYGQVNKNIVGSLDRLKWVEGATWDKKLDFWLSSPVDLDLSLNPNQCLKIWIEAQNASFRKSPLDVIEQNGKEEQLKHYLKDLNYTQVKQLEKRFGHDLLGLWRNQTHEEINIGKMKFLKKDSRYYVQRGEIMEEFTNFTVTVTKIIKKGNNFFRVGYITYEEREYPFEFNNDYFLTPTGFMKNLCRFFFNHGIGIPVVYSALQAFLIDIINRSGGNDVVIERQETEESS